MYSVTEWLLIKAMPRVWFEAGKRIEKHDIFTKALKLAIQNKVIRKTWTPFCASILRWLDDARKEVEDALTWDTDW